MQPLGSSALIQEGATLENSSLIQDSRRLQPLHSPSVVLGASPGPHFPDVAGQGMSPGKGQQHSPVLAVSVTPRQRLHGIQAEQDGAGFITQGN